MKQLYVSINDAVFTVEILDSIKARINGTEHSYELRSTGDSSYILILNNKVHNLFSVPSNTRNPDPALSRIRTVWLDARPYSVTIDDDHSLLMRSLIPSQKATEGETRVCAPMPGLVVRLEVKEGDQVRKGQGLLILEAMKMENEIKSLQDATVRKINVKEKSVVEKGETLLVLQNS